jgi:hypothetical protein
MSSVMSSKGTTTADHDQRIASMKFASVYPHYLAKIEKKGRTKNELHEVISWLTGYAEKALQAHIKGDATFEAFFAGAKLNPNAQLITGTICGYRVEEITNPLTQKARYLDKLIDELAQGKAMTKILRSPESANVAKKSAPGASKKKRSKAKSSARAKSAAKQAR